PVASSDLSNWESDYDLLVGNETSGDRPWRGVLSALAIAPGGLSEINPDHPGNLSNEEFREELGSDDAYILKEPLNLAGADAHKLPSEFSSHFVESAVKQNAFIVILNVATADEKLEGPARIVSHSLDTFNR